jgi:hypothetical protein
VYLVWILELPHKSLPTLLSALLSTNCVHRLPVPLDFYYLRRFLRARNYDVDKAMAMWINHQIWFQDNKVGSILQDFVFKDREALLDALPSGYFNVDREVCARWVDKIVNRDN